MVRGFLKILAAFAVLLWGANLYAFESEEAVAPWESSAQGELWSGIVISGALEGPERKIPLNALCDETAFKTIGSLREKAVKILTAGTEKGTVSGSTRFFAVILKNLTTSDISPLRENERGLLDRVSSLPDSFSLSLKDFLSGGKSREDGIASPLPPAAPGSSNNFQYKVKTKQVLAGNRRDPQNLFQKVNLNLYSLDCGKTDLYHLCLYIWEDNPPAGKSSRVFRSSFASVPSFFHLKQNPFNRTFYTQSPVIHKGVAAC